MDVRFGQAAFPEPSPGVTGRLAPSPTGLLHIGHARSFLCAYWSARSKGGRLVLRIEDLDGDRCKPEFVRQALRDLEWLGLDWDGDPLLQSEASGRLEDAVMHLTLRGAAYACTCSRKDVRFALGAPHAEDLQGSEMCYPGTCRGRFRSMRHAEGATGKAAGLRFRVPPGKRSLVDGFHGPFEEDVAKVAGDFLLARRDGAASYQLAVVVHDALQGVTEVVRGDDLLSSTPRQQLLQRALGLPHPRTYHLPLVHDDEGRRLAKRSGALTLRELRADGCDPEALVSWAARSLGMDAPTPSPPAPLTKAFRWEQVPSNPVRFGSAEHRSLLPQPS